MSQDLLQRELEQLRETVAELQHRLREITDRMLGFILPGCEDIKFSNFELVMLETLFEHVEKVVRRDRLYSVIYATRAWSDECPHEKIIDVYVCKIRRKLKGRDWYIKTHWGTGYSLHQGQEAAT